MDLMSKIRRQIASKRGSQMVEAGISLPVILLAAMLLLRMFIFYLEILTTGIAEHREAMELQDSYRGAFIRTYTDDRRVRMLKGGLLRIDVGKDLETRAYMINEDILVRSGEILD